MPGALEQAGAAREPSSFAPLHTDRIFTGFWPNRSVLRDGATTEYQLRYGLGRQDSMWQGSYNCEVSPFLTLIRRPGLDVFNNGGFPKVYSFYSFHTFTLTDEAISVLVDTEYAVYNGKTGNVFFLKSPQAGRSYFLGVGNTLYLTDGAENKQIVVAEPWKPNTRYSIGARIISNGYIWQLVGFGWKNISSAKVVVTANGLQGDVLLQSNKTYPDSEPIQLFGTNVPGLNELSFPFQWVSQGEVLLNSLPSSVPVFPNFTSIGGFVASVRSSGGTSAATSPFVSNANPWAGEADLLWKNMGPATSDWGIAGPQTAPTVTQSAVSQIYPAWKAATFYGRYSDNGLYRMVLTDSNGNIQVNTQLGTTGANPPVWQTGALATTIDGTVHWQNYGPGAWQANTNTGASDIKQVLATGPGGTAGTYYFIPTKVGVTGATAPLWNNAIGSLTVDGGQVWRNIGPVLDWASYSPNTLLTADTTIVDPNGYIQTILVWGKTGDTTNQPTWNKSPGGQTQEQAQFQTGPGPGAVWINQGSYSAGSTGAVQYAYAFRKGATQDISNVSPRSVQVIRNTGQQVTVQGDGATPAQVGDSVIVYRTLQNGGTLYYLAEFPMPPVGTKWTFIDTFPDGALDQSIRAQSGGEGTVLPLGAGPMAYHLGRIFVGVGNVVWVSSGPDAVNSGSSGNAGFDQFFTLQSKITRFWVTSIGLIVFTVRDSYIFLGTATDSDPLYVKVFIPRLPLLSYDCFAEYMNNGFLYLGTRMVVKLDPGAGVLELSFPVANYLLDDVSDYDPKSSYLTFHTEGSNETALYLSNGISEWMRMPLATTPETGSNWNPPAILSDGISAVQSVEVDPGVFRLLVGPLTTGPIRKRNRKVATDNGRLYSVRTVFGSIAMADPGQLAGLAWLTLTSTIAGSKPELSMLIGEISGTFEHVRRIRQDPPDLPVADSIRSDRHYLLQNQKPVWCRHFQFALDWPAEDAFNELLTFTIFGQIVQELRGS